MVYPLTIAGSAMRDINRSAILEIIRRQGPIARTTIAQRLDVSLPTVMRLVDELIADGFVRLQGGTEWSGGRRRPLLEFNADGHIVLGIDMGGTDFYGALSNLGGTILDELTLGPHRRDGEQNFKTLTDLIDLLLASPRLNGSKVRGIGVGAPGVTLHHEGIVQWAYSLHWQNFPLKARLSERYQLPITVDNDVNLAALGELWFGAGQNCQNMILITIGTGIGAGIIIDGALYRGSHEASGEIGNMLLGRDCLNRDYLDFGALESIASGTGIVARARQTLKDRRSTDDLETITAEEILTAARQGKKWATNLIDPMVDHLAVCIANLMVAFDPELIVLGGGLSPSLEPLIAPILARLQNTIPVPPRLVVSNLGLKACVMGAITNVLHTTSNFYVVHKLS
jgi:glucokinase